MEESIENGKSKSNNDLKIGVSVPGKIILHGEHSVVFGKLAIASSLGLRTEATLSETDDDTDSKIHLDLVSINFTRSYDIRDVRSKLLSSEETDSMDQQQHDSMVKLSDNFVSRHSGESPLSLQQKQASIAFFYLLKGIVGACDDVDLAPFSLSVRTDLQIGAGTGSSASFAVAIAAVLLKYVQTKIANEYSLEVSTTDLESISGWAYRAERIIHGSPSGVDNTICTYGSMVEFSKGSGAKFLRVNRALRILLVDTRVQRDTKKMVDSVAKLKKRHNDIVESILSAIDAIAKSALDCYKKLTAEEEEDDGGGYVLYQQLGELIGMNHDLLRSLRVSHPKSDRICEILSGSGLQGKMTGAGGGGYVIALIPPNFDDDKLAKVVDELVKLDFAPRISQLGGPGVTFT